MSRQPRAISASGVYHVIWRGINRQQIFFDDADCVKFLNLLDSVQNEAFQILAFCLMGNHVHLLIKTVPSDITEMKTAVKRLGIRYVAYFNGRFQRVGPLFQDRYKSQPVESGRYFCRVLRYIHQNPVAAGMCKNPEDYPWSSYCDYFKNPGQFCKVHIKYALQLHRLEWYEKWHRETEESPKSLEGESFKPTDEQAICALKKISGLEISQVVHQNEDSRRRIFRRLCMEEGVSVARAARLTGIPRGEIRRYLM